MSQLLAKFKLAASDVYCFNQSNAQACDILLEQNTPIVPIV